MRILAGLLLIAVGAAAGQAPKRPMTFADLMAMKRVSDPQISTSGKWVMFSVTEVSLAANTKVNHLWVVGIDGKNEHQVTFGDGEANGRFSPDAKWVSIEEKGQIYLAGWDEAEGKPGPERLLTHVSTGADGAVWSPDAGRLLFVSSVYPECSDLGDFPAEDKCDAAKDEDASKSAVKAQLWTGLLYRHWNAFTGSKRSHVFAVSVNHGNDVRDLTPRSAVGDAETPPFSLDGPLGYAWAPDSREIAYVANLDKVPAASTNNDVFTLRLDEAGARAVKVSTSLGSDDGPQYSPDGKWLAFRSQERAGYESDKIRLMLFDRKAKTIKELLPKLDRWVDEFVWRPDSASMICVASRDGATELHFVRLLDGFDYSRSMTDMEFGELRVSSTGDYLVGSSMTEAQPSEIMLHTFRKLPSPLKDSAGTINNTIHLNEQWMSSDIFLSHLNDSLINRLSLSRAMPFWFPGADGVKVQGFVIPPPDTYPQGKYPIKFLIHGGPQGAWGYSWSYRWNAELMAADGYAVVMVNPRGSTGYGQAFIDGVNGDWGGKAYVDLMKGLDFVEAQTPFIDKSRECALGASYGGFMANWILTHTDRFKCIVTHDGMYNPAAAYGDTEELWFNEWEFRRDGDKGPAQPWRYSALPDDQDPFRKWSPMLHIQDAKTPTLVIHSQKDYRLDVSEGMQLFTALQRQNVPSEMLYFPDEGHWVLKPQNSELWYKTVGDWCDKWTKSGIYAGK